ncbi:MAG: DNA repair protein RecO [Azoarcus sp.]|nr:DNA repair protein RecO [Azoarcus sp.]
MSAKQRVSEQPAWVLHTLPWRETSLVVEIFAREHGRVALVAKGARRPLSSLRGVLMAFQPLIVDWSGGGEVKTLIRAEWRGGQPLLAGRALLCGYYVNELLLKLTAREDAHPGLFDAYEAAMAALAAGAALPATLRRFELSLLRELGWGLALDGDAGGQPFQPDASYLYIIEHGARPGATGQAGEGVAVGGQTLLDLAALDFSRAATLTESRRLLRAALDHHLGGKPLQSRRVFRELHEL